MKKDTIKLTFEQWKRIGFSVKEGSKGTKTYSSYSTGHWYTFDETQVIPEQQLMEILYDAAMGYPDKW